MTMRSVNLQQAEGRLENPSLEQPEETKLILGIHLHIVSAAVRETRGWKLRGNK